jgi:hypothetical protein
LAALRKLPRSEWTTAALEELAGDEVVFTGNANASGTGRAAELLRIYRIRLIHCQERGIRTPGIREVVDALAERAPDAAIEVQPFRGPRTVVHAFWDGGMEQLIGCITILDYDPDLGRRTLESTLEDD